MDRIIIMKLYKFSSNIYFKVKPSFPGSSEDTINNSYFISESLFLSCDLNSSSVLLWDIDLNERYHFFKHTETPEKVESNEIKVKIKFVMTSLVKQHTRVD